RVDVMQSISEAGSLARCARAEKKLAVISLSCSRGVWFLQYGFCLLSAQGRFARSGPSRRLTCTYITPRPEAFSFSLALCTVRTRSLAGQCFTVTPPCFCACSGHSLLCRSG